MKRSGFATKRIAPHAGAAFTLIELLVVIAIIAILAAILFPVFDRKGRRPKLISNDCRQVGDLPRTGSHRLPV